MPRATVVRGGARRGERLALVAVVLLLATACGDDADEPSGTAEPRVGEQVGALSGTFLSTEVTGETLVDTSRVTLVFDDGNLAAVAGCNNLIGAYEIVDGVLQVDQLAQTLMACEDDLQRQDEWISNLLTSGPTVSLDGDVLTLSGEDVSIVFGERDVAEASDPLESTAWEMVSLDGPDESTGAPEGASLVFAEGMVNVATGCNRGFAEATVVDDTLTLGPMGMTRMACEGPVGEWESALVEFLADELTFAVDGETLTLTRGAQTLTANAAD
jgi:heat shock protein HslJ